MTLNSGYVWEGALCRQAGSHVLGCKPMSNGHPLIGATRDTLRNRSVALPAHRAGTCWQDVVRTAFCRPPSPLRFLHSKLGLRAQELCAKVAPGGGNRLCPSPSLGPRTWRQLQLNVCVQCMPITQCGVWEGTCDNAIFVDGESVRRQVGGLSAKQQLWHGNVGKQLMNDGCCARLPCRRYKIVRWSRYMFLCHRACVLSPTSSPP